MYIDYILYIYIIYIYIYLYIYIFIIKQFHLAVTLWRAAFIGKLMVVEIKLKMKWILKMLLLQCLHMHQKTFLAYSNYLKHWFKFCLHFFIYFTKRMHLRNFMLFLLPKRFLLFFRYSNFCTSLFHLFSPCQLLLNL